MICRIQQIVLFKKLKIIKVPETTMLPSQKHLNDSKNTSMIIGFMRSWRIFICIKKISKKQRKSFIMHANCIQNRVQAFICKAIFFWKNETMKRLSKLLKKLIFFFRITRKSSEALVGVML